MGRKKRGRNPRTILLDREEWDALLEKMGIIHCPTCKHPNCRCDPTLVIEENGVTTQFRRAWLHKGGK
jgi:hypothetical protein